MSYRLLLVLLTLALFGGRLVSAQDATPEATALAPNVITVENAAEIVKQRSFDEPTMTIIGWTEEGDMLLTDWQDNTPLLMTSMIADASTPTTFPLAMDGENPGAYTTIANLTGTRVAQVTNDGGYGLSVWDVVNQERIAQIPLDENPKPFAMTPDGAHVYFSYGDELLYDIDVDAGTVGEPIEFDGDIDRVVASPSWRLALDVDDDLYIYDLATGEASELDLDGPDALGRMLFSRHGAYFAVVRGNMIEVYDMLSGDKVSELDSGVTDSIVNGLSFSRDGSLLAAGREGLIEIYDVANAALLVTLDAPDVTGPVTTLFFSPDGARLAFTNPQTDVQVWGLPE